VTCSKIFETFQSAMKIKPNCVYFHEMGLCRVLESELVFFLQVFFLLCTLGLISYPPIPIFGKVWPKFPVLILENCWLSSSFHLLVGNHNESSFNPLLPYPRKLKISLFIFEPATGGAKCYVKVHNNDILQCISQIIKLSVRKWNFKTV